MMATRGTGVVICGSVVTVVSYVRIDHVVELTTTLGAAIQKLLISTKINHCIF